MKTVEPHSVHSLKRHLARQFPRFLRHPLRLGMQFANLPLHFLPLSGGDPVDDIFVLFRLTDYLSPHISASERNTISRAPDTIPSPESILAC